MKFNPLVFLCILCLTLSVSALNSPELRVTLTNGSPLLGRYLTSHSGHGIRAFTNIPYAEPPVGPLRFADPVLKAPWTEQQLAQAVPDSDKVIVCPQKEIFFRGNEYRGQEDCLYLNVYVPMHSKGTRPLPVMFFIHGGLFSSGDGGQTLYGPDFLLDEDVILVSGNYRLGALGFLSTFTGEFSGNFGLKDQSMMLQWIQRNIAQFGGDPQRVTIFGQGVGAASVGYHMMSPMSKGLFQGAILQSGSPYMYGANVNQTQSVAFAEKLFQSMNCTVTPGEYKTPLDCVRGKDAMELVMKSDSLWDVAHHQSVFVFGPVLEKNSVAPFLTDVDYNQAQIGVGQNVMMGLTANEGALLYAIMHSEGVQVSFMFHLKHAIIFSSSESFDLTIP